MPFRKEAMARRVRKLAEGTGRRAGSLFLPLVLVVAVGFRLFGLNWDEGHLFHPDERKIILVLEEIGAPSLSEWRTLLGPESPLNPHFFSYGSFPIYLLKGTVALLAQGWKGAADYQNIALIGRSFSVAFDLVTVGLCYWLGRRLYGAVGGLLAALMVAFSVLHIQLAHFYTVDTLLATFILAALASAVSFARTGNYRWGALAGCAYGLALATKISALPLLAILCLAWAIWAWRGEGEITARRHRALRWLSWQRSGLGRRFRRSLLGGVIMVLLAGIVFLLLEPYALLDWVSFLEDVAKENAMVWGISDVEYTRQYIGTPAYLYQIKQAILFSPGPALGVAALGGGLGAAIQGLKGGLRREEWLILAWIGLYFAITGPLQVKYIRYVLPISAPLCILAAGVWVKLVPRLAAGRLGRGLAVLLPGVVLGGALLYALAFLNMYRGRHPWLRLSEWIYGNIPSGATLAVEHWDHPLPVGMRSGGRWHSRGDYRWRRLELYEEDTPEKLDYLVEELSRSDALILASNRLYGVIPRFPERYPMSSRYYRLLLGEDLGFVLAHDEASYPQLGRVTLMDDTFAEAKLPVPEALTRYRPSRVVLNLGKADESFTVYDHPKALIFRKVRQLEPAELRARLEPPSWPERH